MVYPRWLAAGILSFGLVGHAHAVLMEDQISDSGDSQTVFAFPGVTNEQSVTAGKNGILSKIEIFLARFAAGSAGQIDFFVNLGDPGQDGDNDFGPITIVLNDAGLIEIDVSLGNIPVADGTPFVIGLSGNSGFPLFLENAGGDGYKDGFLFVNGVKQQDRDLNFKTFVEVSIPEPTSLILLFIGLTGLAFARPLRH
jgi:hypothetical protein